MPSVIIAGALITGHKIMVLIVWFAIPAVTDLHVMKHKLQHACIMSELVNQHDQLSSMHGVSSSDNPQAYSMVQT